MWCAVANSYEKLDRSEDAIKCYLRAEGNQDGEGIALYSLANLYKNQGNETQVYNLIYFHKFYKK